MKILLIKPTALGDVAQTLLVASLLKKWPECKELVWLVDEDYQSLVKQSPAIDRVLVFSRRRWLRSLPFIEMFKWAKNLKKEKFDLVLDLQGLFRSGLMTWLTHAPQRIGLASAREGSQYAYNRMIQDTQKHAVDRYQHAVESVTGLKLDKYDVLEPMPLAELSQDLKAKDYIVLHPYSIWNTKLWPWENYQKIIEAFPHKTFVYVGKGDVFPFKGKNVIDYRGKTTMDELCRILSNAQLVLTTDSGPAHIASIFNVPTLCLFGATDWEKTAPKGSNVELIHQNLDCQPCLKRECVRPKTMECMTSLTPEMIIEAIKKKI